MSAAGDAGSTSEPVRFGLLSTARINERVLGAAAVSDDVEVIAVASREASRAERYAREHELERAYGRYEALLADDDVEAVYVSLPNALHVEWSVRGLQAGKHVLCEKPLARRPDDVEIAFEAAEAADRFLMEAFMFRHHPQLATLGGLVDDGTLGEVRLVRAAFSFPLQRLGDPRMRPELDGGSLMDVGCYCVSASRFLAGEPVRVAGEQALASTGVDVRFAGTMAFANDVLAHFDCAFDLAGRAELEVVGSDGVVFLPDPWHGWRARLELRRGDARETIPVEKTDPYRLELENLADAIRGRAAPLLGREDARGQVRTIDALYRSAAEGVTVTL